MEGNYIRVKDTFVVRYIQGSKEIASIEHILTNHMRASLNKLIYSMYEFGIILALENEFSYQRTEIMFDAKQINNKSLMVFGR